MIKHSNTGWLAVTFILLNYNMLNAQTLTEFNQKLPQKLSLWQTTESEFYQRENLHEYINGGAELYLSYGFMNLFRRKYEAPNKPPIYLDIFDMVDSKNAFGVFSQSREEVGSIFGQGSQYTQGLLLFWKDHFFISILVSPETAEAKKALLNLAQSIESLITETGKLPVVVSLLPHVNLREESIRYFYHYIWLNSHFFIAAENILNINDNTEAILAKYGEQGKDCTLLLIQYPGVPEAEEAKKRFVAHYIGKNKITNRIKNKEGFWTGWERNTTLFTIVFRARSEKECSELLVEVRNNFKRTIDKVDKND